MDSAGHAHGGSVEWQGHRSSSPERFKVLLPSPNKTEQQRFLFSLSPAEPRAGKHHAALLPWRQGMQNLTSGSTVIARKQAEVRQGAALSPSAPLRAFPAPYLLAGKYRFAKEVWALLPAVLLPCRVTLGMPPYQP